jgi:hypothetical protein
MLHLYSHRLRLELPQAPAPSRPRGPAHACGVRREHGQRDGVARFERAHSQVHRARRDVRLYGVQHSLTLPPEKEKTYEKKDGEPISVERFEEWRCAGAHASRWASLSGWCERGGRRGTRTSLLAGFARRPEEQVEREIAEQKRDVERGRPQDVRQVHLPAPSSARAGKRSGQARTSRRDTAPPTPRNRQAPSPAHHTAAHAASSTAARPSSRGVGGVFLPFSARGK